MEPRCLVTRNPLGTDTWEVEHPCRCSNCQSWLAGFAAASSRAQAAEAREAVLRLELDRGWSHIVQFNAVFSNPSPAAAALVELERAARSYRDAYDRFVDEESNENMDALNAAEKAMLAAIAALDRARGG